MAIASCSIIKFTLGILFIFYSSFAFFNGPKISFFCLLIFFLFPYLLSSIADTLEPEVPFEVVGFGGVFFLNFD